MKFEATWDSLQQYQEAQWFKDGKLGIFIHWGVFSVPGYGCWYGQGMYNPNYTFVNSGLSGKIDFYNYHRETYGPQNQFGYKDLIPLFTAPRFDPDEWCEVVKSSGARYMVPVADFHDAFAMYDSDLTPFTAVKMGPRRNIIGELRDAAQRHGLKFGVSSHLAFNPLFFPKHPDFDTADPRYELLYGPKIWEGYPDNPNDFRNCYYPNSFVEYWYRRTIELIDKTQPDQLWFDMGFGRPEFEPYRRKMAAYYYNQAQQWDREVVLAYKSDFFREGTAVKDMERASQPEICPYAWQTDTSVGTCDWSYTEYEVYKPVEKILADFIDIVSKNGCLLLNIGPRPDGTIPEEQKHILSEMGRWLAVNGEAIYETRPWCRFGEGPAVIGGADVHNFENTYTGEDIRFTTKGKTLYALFLKWPGSGVRTIHSLCCNALLGQTIRQVSLLGHGPVPFRHDHLGLHVRLPEKAPCDYAVTLRIEMQ